MAPQVGLEPTTLRLTAGCSAIELLRSVVGPREKARRAPHLHTSYHRHALVETPTVVARRRFLSPPAPRAEDAGSVLICRGCTDFCCSFFPAYPHAVERAINKYVGHGEKRQ